MLLLKFYTVPMRLHDTKNVVNQNILFNQTRVKFLPRKYDVISQLHHSYTKGSFCVTRLIYSYILWQSRSSWQMLLNHLLPTGTFGLPLYPLHTLSPRDSCSRPGSCTFIISSHQQVPIGINFGLPDMCPVFFITNGCSGNKFGRLTCALYSLSPTGVRGTNSVAWHVPCILYHQRVFWEHIRSPDMCPVFFITNGCSGNKFGRLT